MTHHEATRLREQVDRLMALRTWLMRVEVNSNGALSDIANRLESEIVSVEEAIDAAADRLDPPPARFSGQQWIAGLSVPIGRVR
jgi:hypothetical protein